MRALERYQLPADVQERLTELEELSNKAEEGDKAVGEALLYEIFGPSHDPFLDQLRRTPLLLSSSVP